MHLFILLLRWKCHLQGMFQEARERDPGASC